MEKLLEIIAVLKILPLFKDYFFQPCILGFAFDIFYCIIVCDRLVLLFYREHNVSFPSSRCYSKRMARNKMVGRNKHAFQSTGNTHHDKYDCERSVSL